jgi:hypothetical protein
MLRPSQNKILASMANVPSEEAALEPGYLPRWTDWYYNTHDSLIASETAKIGVFEMRAFY